MPEANNVSQFFRTGVLEAAQVPGRLKNKNSASHLQNVSLGRGLPDPTDVCFLLYVTCPSTDHISPSILSLYIASVFPTQGHVTSMVSPRNGMTSRPGLFLGAVGALLCLL